jgi:hypothetical protein
MNIQFDEQNSHVALQQQKQQKPGLTQWLISKGIVKSEKQAQVVQLVAALIFFAAAVFVAIT